MRNLYVLKLNAFNETSDALFYRNTSVLLKQCHPLQLHPLSLSRESFFEAEKVPKSYEQDKN